MHPIEARGGMARIVGRLSRDVRDGYVVKISLIGSFGPAMDNADRMEAR